MDSNASPQTRGVRNHKDRLFCDIFSHKEYALSLFNAVNNTDYTDVENLEIVTIESVVYVTMNNDLAVCFHDSIQLYEQQSTWSPNMPLREFLYCADEYDKWLVTHEQDVLSRKAVKIPAPRCFELYNGTTEEPEMTEKCLSDAFLHPSPGYEWTVYVININAGKNRALMERCPPLLAYAQFVQKVRDGRGTGLSLDDAIGAALDYCIEGDLLAKYFAANRGRVTKMMLTEYSTAIHEKKIREEGLKEGHASGLKEGVLKTTRSLMETMKISAHEAMTLLKIPPAEQGEYLPLL